MVLSIIGQAIRQLREENGQSVEEVAALTGVSPERISRIENNQAFPSLGLLFKLSRALGPKASSLAEGDFSRRAVVVRAGELAGKNTLTGKESRFGGHLQVLQLAKEKADRHMEPILMEVAPCSEPAGVESEADGEEFLYVLEGTILLHYNDEVYRLSAGDSIYYSSCVPHCLWNDTRTPARVLAVIYTPY